MKLRQSLEGSRDGSATTLILLACLLTVLVYIPGLSGNFIFDDIHVIAQNAKLQTDEISFWAALQVALSSNTGPLLRPIPMLSFWANYLSTGLDPYFFKLTGLLVHLVTGLLLFRLSLALLDARAQLVPGVTESRENNRLLAAVAASLWLVHPINLTGVLYVCQRMTSLSALFTVMGLIGYLQGRLELEKGHRRGIWKMILAPLGFGLLASLSKESGVLMGAYLLSLELGFLGFASQNARIRLGLIRTYTSIIGLASLGLILYLSMNPDWILSGYLRRDFSLSERLMTEARVLWTYLGWIVAPSASALGLFHDDIATSRGLLEPITTLLSIGAWIAALIATFALRKHMPTLLLATLWFLGGHALESSVIGLELVHEHRNYLPSFGPLMLLAFLCVGAARRSYFVLGRSVALVFGALLAFSTLGRAQHWGDPLTFFQVEARHHPESARANIEAGRELYYVTLQHGSLSETSVQAIEAYLVKGSHADRSSLPGLFTLLTLYKQAGRQMPAWLMSEMKRRLATISNLQPDLLHGFLKILEGGGFAMAEDEVMSLFEAALSNPHANERSRGMLYALAASYYGNVRHDMQRTVSLAIAATEADPEMVAHRLNLAELAIRMGNIDFASQQLDAATRFDSLMRHHAAIARLRQRAAERQSAR